MYKYELKSYLFLTSHLHYPFEMNTNRNWYKTRGLMQPCCKIKCIEFLAQQHGRNLPVMQSYVVWERLLTIILHTTVPSDTYFFTQHCSWARWSANRLPFLLIWSARSRAQLHSNPISTATSVTPTQWNLNKHTLQKSSKLNRCHGVYMKVYEFSHRFLVIHLFAYYSG